MDRAVHAGHRAEAGGEIHIVGGEVAGRGDFASAVPVDPPLAADPAINQGDHAFGQAGQLFRLEIVAEGDAGTSSTALPVAGRQIVSNGDIGDRRAAGRMLERPGCADPAVGQREMNVVTAQADRISADRRDPRAVRPPSMMRSPPRTLPLARCLAQQQRDLADDRVGAGKCAAGPGAAAVAADLLGIDQNRRIRLAHPTARLRASKLLAFDSADLACGERERRLVRGGR